MVTNPATRDWTVTASTFATLNEMYGNRTICGIGRGDRAVRVTNGRPTTLATSRERSTSSASSATAARSSTTAPPSASRGAATVGSTCGWRPTGPRRWRSPARWATGSSCSWPTRTSPPGRSRRCARQQTAAGRDPASVKICVAAPAYVGDDVDHQREQCRWFGGMVGNHVADIVARYGAGGAAVPPALTDYIKGRAGLRLQRARPGREHPHPVRARLDRRSVLHPRPGGQPHRPAEGA